MERVKLNLFILYNITYSNPTADLLTRYRELPNNYDQF